MLTTWWFPMQWNEIPEETISAGLVRMKVFHYTYVTVDNFIYACSINHVC